MRTPTSKTPSQMPAHTPKATKKASKHTLFIPLLRLINPHRPLQLLQVRPVAIRVRQRHILPPLLELRLLGRLCLGEVLLDLHLPEGSDAVANCDEAGKRGDPSVGVNFGRWWLRWGQGERGEGKGKGRKEGKEKRGRTTSCLACRGRRC